MAASTQVLVLQRTSAEEAEEGGKDRTDKNFSIARSGFIPPVKHPHIYTLSMNEGEIGQTREVEESLNRKSRLDNEGEIKEVVAKTSVDEVESGCTDPAAANAPGPAHACSAARRVKFTVYSPVECQHRRRSVTMFAKHLDVRAASASAAEHLISSAGGGRRSHDWRRLF